MKNTTQKILSILLTAALMPCILAGCSSPDVNGGSGESPPPAAEDAGELYATGMEKLDEATDLSITSKIHLAVESSDGDTASADITLYVKLNKPDGKLNMSSVNEFSNVEGEYFKAYGMKSGAGAEAWYRDGWLYLRNIGDETGAAQSDTQEDIFNIYTFGRVLLEEDQILSQSTEIIGDETLITQHTDPAVVAQHRDSLLGTLAGISAGDTVFTELTLTMRLDQNGDPVQYGMRTSFKTTMEEKYQIWTIDATASNISTDPVEIVFPDNLDSFYKRDTGDTGDTEHPDDNPAPAKTLSPEEQSALVESLMPPDAELLDNPDGEYYFDTGMSQAEAVAWVKEKLSLQGISEAIPADLDIIQLAFPDADVIGAEKDGVTFTVIIAEYLIVITFGL